MTDTGSRAPAGQRPPDDRLDRGLIVIGAVVVLGTITAILDATIVNVATRTLAEHFRAPADSLQWVLTGYLLGFAGVIPVTGWAVERFGARRVWTTALLIFLAGSALAGAAWSLSSLIAFRVLQGLGGGMIMPVGQAILARAAGPRRMGRMMAFTSLPMMLGSVTGPVVGGLLVTTVGWRWIFFVNLPVGAVAVALSLRLLPSAPARPDASLDVRGLLLLSTGVTALIYGASELGAAAGSGAGWRIALPLAGVILLALYALHARSRGARALIDLSLFRHRGFTAAVLTNTVVAVALFGVLVLLPLYWQVVRGHDALATGLLLAPQAVGAAVALPIAGRVADRRGAGVVVPIGVVVGLLGTGVYTQVTPTTPAVVLAAALFVIGLGLGATISPSMAAAYKGLPGRAIPQATSALQTLQRVGASIGTAAMAIVLQRQIVDRTSLPARASLAPLPAEVRARLAPALADSFAYAFWTALAIGGLAALTALLLPRSSGGRPAPAEKGS
ncbi:DHA2 family efflux MFS transporter permease subunit [Actinomadura roseirufa]|uniref:DHA2 family efflux MFS transporter permease subunit n=1 Tax=Actinomadura roseirufa TaxID=2094049 RepID=UPI0010410DF8|nr:DHA2 family efflux MFS transporter permease subunit [Actinomadura roseirufa]